MYAGGGGVKSEATVSEDADKRHRRAEVVKARLPRRANARAPKPRRAARKSAAEALPPERGGQQGPEPTRYGDWEKKGIISDF